MAFGAEAWTNMDAKWKSQQSFFIIIILYSR